MASADTNQTAMAVAAAKDENGAARLKLGSSWCT